MDHEAYERHMIDTVNRHAEEAAPEPVVAKRRDAGIIARGLKRTVLALLTTFMLVIAVIGYIAVASVDGYMAVLLFFASTVALVGSFIFLYAQGITRKEG